MNKSTPPRGHFSALTISCARCHDHKFDAFSQADYYALAGIFRSSQTHFGTKSGGGNRQGSTLMPIGENADEKVAALKVHNQKIAALAKKVKAKERETKKARQKIAALKRQEKMGAVREMESEMKEATTEMKRTKNRIEELRKNSPPQPNFAMGLTDRSAPVDSALLIRGNTETKGKVIPRGIPVVFEPVTGLPKIAENQSGRLELADWIASDKNPLTSRVMANRVWSHLFGEGIVPTVDNFGESGQTPSNVELLDFLAASFVENGWSVKKLIRQIMLSDAYQRSSAHHPGNFERDPDNRFIWHQSLRRLDAESIRDSILSFAGELNPSPGAGSVVEKMGDKNYGRDRKLTAQFSEAIRKPNRSIYLPVIRNATPTALKIFDVAESSLIVGKRNETNVPTQALFMMNSEFIIKNAEKIADRIQSDDSPGSKKIEKKVARAFELILGRTPSGDEISRALELISSHGDPEAGLVTFCQALISSAEFRYLN